MPPSTPAPGRPGAPPRRGMGGVVGLLAVLAFVILAGVILTRREPDRGAVVPPPSPSAPVSTVTPMPSEAPAPLPSEAPPSTEPAIVAAGEPAAPGGEPPPPGKNARSPRRPRTAPATGGTAAADTSASPRRGSGSLPSSGLASRRFLLGTTSIESLKPVERDLKGFEKDSVGVKRAPEVNGRVELEMNPAIVRPGVDYAVKVYLANDGGKDIPVEEIEVSTVENGKSVSRTMTPRARIVKPRQRVLLNEVSGVWRESARTWAMDVVVTSGRQDVYRNRLRWE